MDITTLFPILASKTTTIDLESDNVFAKISSSMSSLAFFIFVVCLIKEKTTRKFVN